MSDTGPTLQHAYREWLKIPAGLIPPDHMHPDHYALLGLNRFEGDPARIQQATLDRMKIVRPRCLKYHELGTQLLNRIAQANVCLSHADQRAAYDASLRSGSVTAAGQPAPKAAGEDRARLQQLLAEAKREVDVPPTLHAAYRDWLSIPASQLPPDHYALLGLARFESDPARIQQATLDRMKLVRPRCLKYHELGTQLLNKIAQANVCLSHRDQKAAYDASLRTGGITAAVQSAHKAVGEDRVRLQQLLDEARRDLQAGRVAKDSAKNGSGQYGSEEQGHPKPPEPPRKIFSRLPPPPPEDDFELTLSTSDTDDSFELTLDDDFDLSAADSGISLNGGESDFDLSLEDEEFELSLDDDFDVSLDDDDDFDLSLDEDVVVDPIERNVRRLLEEERRYRQRRAEADAIFIGDEDEDWDEPDETETAEDERLVPPPVQPLTENQKALLLVGVLTLIAVIAIGGLIIFNVRRAKLANEGTGASGAFTEAPVENPAGQAGANPYISPSPTAGSAGDPFAAATGSGLSGQYGETSLPGSTPDRSGLTEDDASSNALVERFVGTLVRVEQRPRQVALSAQITSVQPASADPDLPPSSAYDPLPLPTLVTAIVDDPAFAKNIFDYQSNDEGVDEVLAPGRSGESLGTEGNLTFTGDTVEIVGVRSGAASDAGSGAVVIRLQSIQKAGQPETLAFAGEPRLGSLDTSIHHRRTPLRKLLRGWNTGFTNRALVVGSVLDASDISHVRFQPDLTALPIVVNAATLNYTGQSLLSESIGELQLTVSFNGAFDDLGQPILLALAVSPEDAVATTGPAPGTTTGEAFSRDEPAETRGGLDVDAPYRPEPAYVEERWYVIQVPDTFTKTVEYLVVNGEEAKKATIADYRASGIKAYAATTSYKTEDEAYAYVDRMQAKRMPRNEFSQ